MKGFRMLSRAASWIPSIARVSEISEHLHWPQLDATRLKNTSMTSIHTLLLRYVQTLEVG